MKFFLIFNLIIACYTMYPAEYLPIADPLSPASAQESSCKHECKTCSKRVFAYLCTIGVFLGTFIGIYELAMPAEKCTKYFHAFSDSCNNRCPQGFIKDQICPPPYSMYPTIEERIRTICPSLNTLVLGEDCNGHRPGPPCKPLEEQIDILNRTCTQSSQAPLYSHQPLNTMKKTPRRK